MKKTFLARRNALFSSAKISFGVFALIFAVSMLLLRILAPNFFWHIFTPIFSAANTTTEASHSFFNGFRNTAKLALQNEMLIRENFALKNHNQAMLEKVRSVSGLVSGVDEIIAGVIVRPPESPYDTLVISAGAEDGVAEGMKAFGYGGVPIGAVSSVLNNFSRITLFSAPGMSTNGWVGNESIPIIIKGAGAGAMNVSIPRSADIRVGDIVFVSGPGKLPIGSIVRIDSDMSSPSIILRIMPSLNLFSISWVVVRDTGISLP